MPLCWTHALECCRHVHICIQFAFIRFRNIPVVMIERFLIRAPRYIECTVHFIHSHLTVSLPPSISHSLYVQVHISWRHQPHTWHDVLCRHFNHLFTAYSFHRCTRKQTEYSLCIYILIIITRTFSYKFYNHFWDNEAELVIYVVVII